MSNKDVKETIIDSLSIAVLQHTLLSMTLGTYRIVNSPNYFSKLCEILNIITPDLSNIPKDAPDYQRHVEHMALHIVDDLQQDIQSMLALIHQGIVTTKPGDPVHVEPSSTRIITPGFDSKMHTYLCHLTIKNSTATPVTFSIPFNIYINDRVLSRIRGAVNTDDVTDPENILVKEGDSPEILGSADELMEAAELFHKQGKSTGFVVKEHKEKPEVKPIINKNHKNVA